MGLQRAALTLTFFTSFGFTLVDKASGIRCYQCISTNNTHPFQCNEFLSSDIDIGPEPCDDVFDAQYCVKHVGRFEAGSLDCYQCSSAVEWQCTDGDLLTSHLLPMNCSHVYDARYCVKTIGRYGDGIGTKRFCSSVDEGNYCDYVKHLGDKLTYRSCIYTCTGDGCNFGSSLRHNTLFWLVLQLAPLSSWLAHSAFI